MTNVQPKKYLGQHFLTDTGIAKKICDSLPPECVNLLEIGPGKGVLTQYLLELYNFKAIEIDSEAIDYLGQTFPQSAGKIVHADFLKTDLLAVFLEHFDIIGNFPYNISSQILFKVIDYKDNVDCVVGMFQKEVAQRIISPPGSKVYGILSVLIQTWYDCEYLFTINEGSFFPAPKVKSGVIRLRRNAVKDIEVSEKTYINVVKTAFNQRRKTLRNSLRSFGLEDSEILQKRPEQLKWQEFVELTKQYVSKNCK